jgi:hypothetical protein
MDNNISRERRFKFWQKWLFYSSLIFAGFGIVLAFYGNNLIFEPYYKMLAEIFWDQSDFPGEAANFRDFVAGPLGSTIASCYIMLAFIAYFPFKKKERWARNAIVAAFSAWFFIDSAIGLYFGVFYHVLIINVFSVLQKALPLIFTWKTFH